MILNQTKQKKSRLELIFLGVLKIVFKNPVLTVIFRHKDHNAIPLIWGLSINSTIKNFNNSLDQKKCNFEIQQMRTTSTNISRTNSYLFLLKIC